LIGVKVPPEFRNNCSRDPGFGGLFVEEANAPADSFNEIWHIQKSES